MMNVNEDVLTRALEKINIQLDAITQVLAGGRQINGNSFDYNNLMTTKEHIEGKLAAFKNTSKKK